jgi:dTMP kinase
MQQHSMFIVIEGLDGSGKTQASRRLQRILSATHARVALTFEPYDPSAAGLYIRNALTKRIKVDARSLALAFALNRTDHCARVVRPYLDHPAHSIMLCDRYYLSSLVYQSVEPLTMDDIMTLNAHAIRPDLIFFLNASTQTCYERMRKRPEDKELFENRLDRTRDKYHKAIVYLRARGETVIEVDANGTPEQVLNEILDHLAVHAPDWLRIQRTLSEPDLDAYTLNEWHDDADPIGRFVQTFLNDMPRQIPDDLATAMTGLKTAVERAVERLTYDELAGLFLSVLGRVGYIVLDRLEWTEVVAFEMAYMLPLGVMQRGTALLLTDAQRQDVITRRTQQLLDEVESGKELHRLSDFMFVLDPATLTNGEPPLERDGSYNRVSPSVRVLGRQDIARLVLGDVLLAVYGGDSTPEYITDALYAVGLRDVWDAAVNHQAVVARLLAT